MDFAALPPEVISTQMYSGPGSGPILAAATSWDGLAVELQETASAYGAAIAELTETWQGPSAATMSAAAMPFVTWLSTTAGQAREAAVQATAAASAYQDAFASTVPPPLIAANRSQLAALLATNTLGQNTAAIAATEAAYAQMWLQNTATMYTYAAAASAATRTTPFTVPPQPTDPSGAANAAAASAAVSTQSPGGVLTQLLNGLSSAGAQFNGQLNSMDTALGGLLGVPSTSGFYEDVFGAFAAVSKASTWGNATMSVPNLAMVQFKAFYKAPISIVDIPRSTLGAALHTAPLPASTGLVSSVSAGAGEANLVGRLSVPPAWASATPAIKLAATSLPGTGLAAVPAADVSRGLLPPMALGSLAGAALGGSPPRVLNATAGSGSAAAKVGKAPVKLDRVIAQLQHQPNSVRHWSVDKAGLDDLIAELSKKPGVHAVHLSAGK